MATSGRLKSKRDDPSHPPPNRPSSAVRSALDIDTQAGMPVSETFRTVVLVFLGTHIPATLMMDSQALLPPAIVPGFMKSLLQFHVDTNADPLMANPPTWFKSFILFELLFQLPFFFIGFKAFYERKNWIRIPGVVYGAHTATTLVPILAEILHSDSFPDEAARWKLFFIYLPYLIVPASMAYVLGVDDKPFGAKGGTNKLKLL